ncbi:VOC family protein [Skermania sp. ID1734]|nr:VOC family protein [Skermania sp. ID1734]
MHVSQLAPSVKFYCDVLGCRVSVQDDQAALLIAPDGFQIYLHESHTGARRRVGDVGVEFVMWATETVEELDQITARLRAYDPSTCTQTVNGITFVDGVDPDEIRILIAHPSPHDLPRTVIASRFR